jgi:DNA-binding transcriptional LysR family regulator
VPKVPDDLRDHNIIAYQYQESATDWHFLGPDKNQITVPVSGSIQMNNSLALREALLGGAGITRTPTFVVGDDVAAGKLVSLLPNYETLEVSIYLVYPQRRHLSPKVRAFVDFMAARISPEPHWDVAS